MTVEPCWWHLCPFVSVDALLDVHLIWEGKSITKRRVPLCAKHLAAFQKSGRVRLQPELLLAPEPR